MTLEQSPGAPLAAPPAEPLPRVITVIGFGRRFVAYLIDALLLYAVTFCLSFGVMTATISGRDPQAAANTNLTLQCLGVLIAMAYFVIFWATAGATPGKMALGIKVIGTDGQPVTWGKAILRYIGYIVSGLVIALGFIWIAFDARRQGWHDKIANTYVVPKETQFSPGEPVTFVPSDSGGATVVVVLIALAAILVLVAITVIAILLLLGPVVGNVFSNIVENLGTPAPR
jgi:uncharacterized RDD family membrane protein YckC